MMGDFVTELLDRLVATLERGLPVVYCTVVETRGSTPQKAGAAMLVFPDGTQAGTLGGGCVEAEVRQRALHALAAGSGPEVRSFLLDDDYAWADGLICGGRLTVLAHPLSREHPNHDAAIEYYTRLRERVALGEGFIEVLVIGEVPPLPIGDRYLFDSAGERITCFAVRPAWNEVGLNLPLLDSRPKPVARNGLAFLPSSPRITLLIVGGGHVGQAVARLAAEVGFGVWVLDDRERFASAERFPAAERRIIGPIGDMLRALVPQLTANTYGLVMTRGHGHDEEALYHLAESRCGYVGMIGSKRKIRLIFDDLLAKGINSEALNRVHAPLGIDIGSQTVPEIAVSIVAELIACRNLGVAAR
jgi:xanthine dehydrogenase accessory factor